MNFKIEFEREDDGRRIAEIPDVSGVMAYGATQAEASTKALALLAQKTSDWLDDLNRFNSEPFPEIGPQPRLWNLSTSPWKSRDRKR
jgi:predicted RNase H-like HicB family nuclease